MTEPFRRKDPEEILRSIYKMNRGRLKIILGAVSGSGKTYHMLLEGNSLKKKGIDVVIGMVSPTERPRTMEQIGCLETIPPIHWMDGWEAKQDLDLDHILKRNPEVVLIDALAGRNRPGATHATRLDDVNFLLSHKISVITTVNVYELEGIHEMADKMIGGVKVDCFLPEDTLALADEVKLLDVTPEVILKRWQEGIIDSSRKVLFQRSNLAILREISLRVLAGEVNEELEEYRDQHGMEGPSGAGERILVPVQYNWNGSILIRRGQQVAKRLGADLLCVCFRSPSKPQTKEEETFKRSMKKLVEKVGGEFEELPLEGENQAAYQIVKYAVKHQISQIIMGQTKRTRWEEIWFGSIVQKILRKTRNIDIFIVADRSEKKGERVIPTKRVTKSNPNPYHRLTPEEVEERIHQIRRGTHKVYIGAAPGVGKTYTMLREANELKKRGIDVVIGLLETHGRTETLEQVGELELIPRKRMPYKGTVLEEMDTEAIIERDPEVVLVDELAHTNVPGSHHKKRYEDVEEMLNKGISVISTMNIQHLESLNDSVEQITGVRVRETVPDFVLHQANEVELIDISPGALRQRMREGDIYALEKVEQSLNHFFKTGNLIALRELALREVADDVDERLEAWERNRTLRGKWRQEEVIFVCVKLRDDSERLIRRGFRLSYRLKAVWFVTYVKDHHPFTIEEEQNLEKVKRLTEQLGGIFKMYQVSDRRKVFKELVDQMNKRNATQVIIGQSARTRWQEIRKGSVVQQLLRRVRHMDVLIVSDHS